MSANSSIAAESRKPPEILEQEIDQQRDRIDALIDAVEARLKPQRLIDQALAYGRERGGLEMAERLGQTLKANPVPLAMTIIGLAWLAVEQTHRHAPMAPEPDLPDDHESLAEALHDARQSLQQSTQAARRKLHDLAEAASAATARARQSADAVGQAVHRHPWAFAAAGLAAGAIVGLLARQRSPGADVAREPYAVPDSGAGFEELAEERHDEPPWRPGAI